MDSSRALWAKFEKSGKLSDYLSFCEARRQTRKEAKQNESGDEAASRGEDQSSL